MDGECGWGVWMRSVDGECGWGVWMRSVDGECGWVGVWMGRSVDG